MPLLISKTYTEYTPESVKEGDCSDTGFVFQDGPLSFRELVDTIKRDGFTIPSCYPARGETHEWISNYSEVTDYRTGTEREESLHFSRSNPPRASKYWRKAMQAAGVITTK